MGSSGSKTKIIENQKETGTKIQAVNAFSAAGKAQIKQNNKMKMAPKLPKKEIKQKSKIQVGFVKISQNFQK